MLAGCASDLTQLRDLVTCGQCGDRFSLADLARFLQHKMAANCRRPPATTMAAADSRDSLSSPRVSGTDEAVTGARWKSRLARQEAEPPKGPAGIQSIPSNLRPFLYLNPEPSDISALPITICALLPSKK